MNGSFRAEGRDHRPVDHTLPTDEDDLFDPRALEVLCMVVDDYRKRWHTTELTTSASRPR